VSLLRKSTPAPEPEPEPVVEAVAGKGRPTPKRRDIAPKRQPMSAPRTTKEANRLRKQQSAEARKNPSSAKALSTREYREALRRGDESVLPRRDKGPVRRLARDWVDTHHMASNYLLLAFPLLLFAGYIPNHLGTFVTIGIFVLFAVEWLWTGRRIHALAVSRFDTVTEKAWVLGMYAGQRSFLPRRWRAPQATLRRGDKI
jgi:Protein of unknown function (DUF3043)